MEWRMWAYTVNLPIQKMLMFTSINKSTENILHIQHPCDMMQHHHMAPKSNERDKMMGWRDTPNCNSFQSSMIFFIPSVHNHKIFIQNHDDNKIFISFSLFVDQVLKIIMIYFVNWRKKRLITPKITSSACEWE